MTTLLWIMTILFVLLTLVDPRKLWYSTSAWQFKHPQANEPSEASFAVGRVVSGISALCFGIAALATTAGSVAPLSQERLDSAGYAAAGELEGECDKYGSPGVTEIEEAIGRDDVQVREGRTVTADGPFGAQRDLLQHVDGTLPVARADRGVERADPALPPPGVR